MGGVYRQILSAAIDCGRSPSIDQILSAAIDWEVSIDRYCLRQWAGDESIDR